MYCQFKNIGTKKLNNGSITNIHQCQRKDCKRIVYSFASSGDIIANCKSSSNKGYEKCTNRCNVVDMVLCKSCNGQIKIKVFQCTEFTFCTIEKVISGIKTCRNCDSVKLPEQLQ